MSSSGIRGFFDRLGRKKRLEDDLLDTPLRRCMTTVDLVLLGISQMVGAGIFVITGTVAREVAGPAIVLSYFFAGVAAVLSALCYAEFGARVPKAGSAYTYTYVTIGELAAFLVGWNMIMENLIGAASVARAWSGSFDSLFNGAIRNETVEHIGSVDVPGLSRYLDFVALGVVLLAVVFVAAGAKVSTTLNNVLTVVNLVILFLIVGLGLYLSDFANWTADGFLPFGFGGVVAGAGSCFYAYIGFDGIAVAGEEAENPTRAIPLATGLAMAVVSALYVACAAALTLMVPYSTVDTAAPFSTAFAAHGYAWAKLVVVAGALMGITSSLLGNIFTLPRFVYSMASDGMLFPCLAYVHPRTQTPVVSVVVFGLMAGLTALLFDLEVLVELLSIGTLLSYTIVAAGVIVLHYQPVDRCQFHLRPGSSDGGCADDSEPEMTSDRRKMVANSQSHDDIGKLKKPFHRLPLLKSIPPGYASAVALLLMTVFMVSFWVLVIHGTVYLAKATWWALLVLVVVCFGLVVSVFLLCVHERNKSFLTFTVPLGPLVPTLSMLLNIGMMLQLQALTWIRLSIWLLIGFVIYFGYGIWHSSENEPLMSSKSVISYSSGNITATTITGHSDGDSIDVDSSGYDDLCDGHDQQLK